MTIVYLYAIVSFILVFVLRLIRGTNVFIALVLALLVAGVLFALGKVIFEYLRTVFMTHEKIDISTKSAKTEETMGLGDVIQDDQADKSDTDSQTDTDDEDNEPAFFSPAQADAAYSNQQSSTNATKNSKNDTINYVENNEVNWMKNLTSRNNRKANISSKFDSEEIIENASRNPEAVKYAVHKWMNEKA